MPKLLLSNDSFACRSMDHVVFLDLKRERYLALAPDDATHLSSILNSGNVQGDSLHGESSVVDMLKREGLLVQDEARGKCFMLGSLVEPRAALCAEKELLPRLHKSDVLHFIRAWTVASAMMRFRSLKAIVERVRMRKVRRGASARSADVDEALGLARMFATMQPMLPSSGSSDIRRSLTLIEFLACSDIYPSWVFGVRLSPFAATTWVQQGDTVLSGSVDGIRGYSPLMVL